VEGKRKEEKKPKNRFFLSKMYNNPHSAQFGGINPSSRGKFPDRKRNNRKEELPSLYVSSTRAGNTANASCMRRLALHSQAEVERRGHSLA